MVAVYLLGHRVGDFITPVIYVNHKTYDYDGREIVRHRPDPFVESLTHDSIIVQIPLLRGRVTNRLEKLLSVFRQTGDSRQDRQTLRVEEDAYAGDADMEYILRRLVSAAANPEVRQDMNVEDEFFKAIEDRDTTILLREKTIQEQGMKIEEQGMMLEEKDKKLEEKDKKLEEKDKMLEEKDRAIGNAIKGMLSQGMDVSTVSSLLGLSEEIVSHYGR